MLQKCLDGGYEAAPCNSQCRVHAYLAQKREETGGQKGHIFSILVMNNRLSFQGLRRRIPRGAVEATTYTHTSSAHIKLSSNMPEMASLLRFVAIRTPPFSSLQGVSNCLYRVSTSRSAHESWVFARLSLRLVFAAETPAMKPQTRGPANFSFRNPPPPPSTSGKRGSA